MAVSFSWPDVVIVFIPTIPGLLASYYAHKNVTALKTGNGKTVGEMVTEVHGQASTEHTPFETHGDMAATAAPGGEP